MRSFNKVTLRAVIFFFVFTGFYFQGTSQVDSLKINEIIQSHILDNYFEGVVLIAERENIINLTVSGYSDRETGRVTVPDGTFGIASITKMLTAIVILQLVEEKRLSLESSLSEILPDLGVPDDDKITIHHLLLHISGLPDEKDLMYQSKKTPEEFVAETLKKGNPGTFGQFNYANIDYVLLGLTIEKITGNSWQSEVTSRIIEPLDLGNTGFLSRGEKPAQYAWSYQVSKKGNFRRDREFYIENFYAAGCMFSTVFDLWAIDQALYTDQLLNSGSKEKMFTSYPGYNYSGYSVWTYTYPFAESKPRIMERRGGILGSNSVLVRMLDTRRTIIILSNNDQFNPDSFGDPENLREALIIELAK